MNLEEIKSVIYDITAEFFQGATVIFAEQVNTKPKPPYITIKTGGIRRSRFPIVDDNGNRYYLCSTMLELNLYTKGKAVTLAPNVTGNYANTATSDLQDFFNFLDSDIVVDQLASYGIDISLEPPVRDLTYLQNDSKYRYRAMAEATVSFAQEADGPYGVGGMTAPNASGGGNSSMAEAENVDIEDVEITEETYKGGNK